MSELVIDINSDLGESPEALANGTDYQIMRYITSANVACGGHAGDAETMRQTLSMAKELKVAAGAHPSYPDRENFGRLESPLPPAEIEKSVGEQIRTLLEIAGKLGIRLAHVKPHGALYHAGNKNPEIARAVGRSVLAIDPKLIMFGQAGSAALDIWRDMGLSCWGEAFADRAYEPDGTLRNRKKPGAVLDAARAAEQAISIATKHTVLDTAGKPLPVAAQTICIHSDSPGAPTIAREVNQRLKSAGVRVRVA